MVVQGGDEEHPLPAQLDAQHLQDVRGAVGDEDNSDGDQQQGLAEDQGHRGQQASQGQGPDVPHEHLRRVGVEPEVGQQGASHRCRQGAGGAVPLPQGDHAERCHGDGAGGRHQAIHAVGDGHGAGGGHEDEGRQGDVEPARDGKLAGEGQAQGGLAEPDQHPRGDQAQHDLHRPLDARGEPGRALPADQRLGVVHRPQDGQGAGDQQRQQQARLTAGEDLEGQGHGDEGKEEDDAPHGGGAFFVGVLLRLAGIELLAHLAGLEEAQPAGAEGHPQPEGHQGQDQGGDDRRSGLRHRRGPWVAGACPPGP